MVVNFVLVVLVQGLVVVLFLVIVGVLALVVDFREVIRSLTPELAKCYPPPPSLCN